MLLFVPLIYLFPYSSTDLREGHGGGGGEEGKEEVEAKVDAINSNCLSFSLVVHSLLVVIFGGYMMLYYTCIKKSRVCVKGNG